MKKVIYVKTLRIFSEYVGVNKICMSTKIKTATEKNTKEKILSKIVCIVKCLNFYIQTIFFFKYIFGYDCDLRAVPFHVSFRYVIYFHRRWIINISECLLILFFIYMKYVHTEVISVFFFVNHFVLCMFLLIMKWAF